MVQDFEFIGMLGAITFTIPIVTKSTYYSLVSPA